MKNEQIFNLSGGMVSRVSPLILQDKEAEFILNYNLNKVGVLTKRKGYITFASQPVASKTVNGLYQFNDQSAGTVEQLMVANNAGDTNGIIYYNNSGTWTAGKSNDTASKKSRFFTFVDYVFRTNGADVVASSANGSSWGTTNCPSTITPKFGAVFQDRAYVANGVSSNLSRLWYSSLPDSGAITWTTADDWVDVNPDDGDQITGLENNGNRLIIFKNRSMYRWSFGQVEPDRLIGVGTSSQESIRTNLDIGITFFANPNGVYAYTSGRPELISRKIQEYIDVVSDWTAVAAEVDYDHYYLSVGNITVNGRTITNAVFVYCISLDAWTIYSTATSIKIFARLIETAPVENIYFGSNDGRTYNFLSGTSDNSTPIAAEFISKEYMLSLPERTKVAWIDVFSTNHGNTNAWYQFDRKGDFIELGQLTDRITSFNMPVRETNSIRLKCADNSTATSMIEGFNIEHEPKEKRSENVRKIRRKENV